MKTLLAVMSYAGGMETCARHWPYFVNTASAIIGVGHENTVCKFPAEKLIRTANIGQDSYVSGDAHIVRFLKTLELCCQYSYDRIIVTEYDSIFLGHLPDSYGCQHYFCGTLSGYRSPGFMGERFMHAPWCFHPDMACDIAYRYGPRMLKAGLIEGGFIDRFLGLMVDLYALHFTHVSMAYSRNTIQPEHYAEAREAVRNGAPFLHGIKTKECLEAILA